MKSLEQQYYPTEEKLQFKPIPVEEERELFRRAKTDDAVRETLIKRHLLFALKQGRRFSSTKMPVDESTSAANLALMKAIDKFDPERGTTFRAFLIPYIRAGIARAWRAREVVNFKNSVPPPPSNLDTKVQVEYDKCSMPTVEQDDHDDFLREALLEISETLPEREQRVINLHYVEMFNFAEIGRQLNLSREAIRLIHDKVLVKLRKKLTARGITSSQ